MKYSNIAAPVLIEEGRATLLPHNLSPYDKVCEALCENNVINIVAGTGTGKSFLTFALLAGPLASAPQVLYIAPKDSIFYNLQKYPEYDRFRNRISYISNSALTTIEKADWAYTHFDAFILDESHHIGADLTGTVIRSLLERVSNDSKKVFIGLTATPLRDSDRVDTTTFFPAVIYGKTTMDCIEEGLMPQVEYLICKPDADLTPEEKQLYREKLSISDSHELLSRIVKNNPRSKWLCYFGTLAEMNAARADIHNLMPEHIVDQKEALVIFLMFSCLQIR